MIEYLGYVVVFFVGAFIGVFSAIWYVLNHPEEYMQRLGEKFDRYAEVGEDGH